MQVLVRDRREQHEARGGLAVVLLRQRVGDPVVEVLLERGEPGLAGVRLVVAEEGEDDVGLRVRCRRSGSPGSRRSARPCRSATRRACRSSSTAAASSISSPLKPRLRIDQIVLRETGVQQRLEPAVVLHPLGERVADDADVVARRAARTDARRCRRAGDRTDRAPQRRQARRAKRLVMVNSMSVRLVSCCIRKWPGASEPQNPASYFGIGDVPAGHVRRLHALDEAAEVRTSTAG